MNPAQEELQRRQFAGVPDSIVKKTAELPPEEFSLLGTPITINNGSGNLCNCKDGGKLRHYGWDNIECERCGGYSY